MGRSAVVVDRMTEKNAAPPCLDRDSGALQRVYASIAERRSDAGFVLGQLGQSLDGRIAAPNGQCPYINGPEAIALFAGWRSRSLASLRSAIADRHGDARAGSGNHRPPRKDLPPGFDSPPRAGCSVRFRLHVPPLRCTGVKLAAQAIHMAATLA